ncbi:MAG: ABC transporter permease [Chloroflexota bacterium]
MKKLFLIGLKDLRVIFRDRAALVMMLVAPFALTIGLGFVTGQFGGGNGSGISDIPVILVNQDSGPLGGSLVDLFQSEALADLVKPVLSDDLAAARNQVDEDNAAAAILIPDGFSASIIPSTGQQVPGDVVQLVLYANPVRPTSVGVVKAILDEFISHLEVGRVGGTVSVTQLLTNGLIPPEQAAAVGMSIGGRQAESLAENNAIQLVTSTASETTQFNPLAYIAPGMALMFLMFTVSNAGRSLLVERARGTLPRLLVSPTTTAQVLGGKVCGVYLSGAAQMLILIGGSTLLFQLDWGDILGVLVLVLAAVFGATGWGLLITAMAKTPGQAAAVGSAIMLTFGILGGTFINLEAMPAIVQAASKITPNAWGLDGFATLALGGGLEHIMKPVLALFGMGLVLFAVSLALFNRRKVMQR